MVTVFKFLKMTRQWECIYVLSSQIRICIGVIIFFALNFVNLANGGDLGPKIFQGKGSQCVAETEFMRINHMNLLVHQGEKTLRRGIRGGDFSLKECISCHTVPGKDNNPVTFDSDQHFCRSCHDYAAVKIDCFSCHNSVPESQIISHNKSILAVFPTFLSLIENE